MILVTAAGGMTGLAVTAALRGRGMRVRALIRTDRADAALTGLGADVVVGSLLDDDVVAAALEGCTALYLIWPNFDPDEAEGATAVARRAVDAGVGRIVYHSVLRPQLEQMRHHWQKLRVEEYLDTLGVDYRVLQPAAYLDNIGRQLDAVRAEGRYLSPWGVRARLSYVDLRDVAEAAATALATDGLDRGAFELCGPDPLDARDVARTLQRCLRRTVTAVDGAVDGAVDQAAGAVEPDPDDYPRRCLVEMSAYYRRFGFVGPSLVLTSLLGRPPGTLDAYVTSLTA